VEYLVTVSSYELYNLYSSSEFSAPLSILDFIASLIELAFLAHVSGLFSPPRDTEYIFPSFPSSLATNFITFPLIVLLSLLRPLPLVKPISLLESAASSTLIKYYTLLKESLLNISLVSGGNLS